MLEFSKFFGSRVLFHYGVITVDKINHDAVVAGKSYFYRILTMFRRTNVEDKKSKTKMRISTEMYE